MTWTDGPGFSLCAAPLESSFKVTWQNCSGRNGSLEYSRLERDGEDLESKRGQDLVDIPTDSTVHWWLTYITTGNSAGSRAQQGDE